MAAAADVAVVGLGAAGSAALYHLARRGLRVLGLEAQPAPGHDRGSSHGGSRIIRLVYQEDPRYLPLLRRAYALWRELEQETGLQLLRATGCLNASAPGGAGAHGHSCFDGALASAQQHGLPHELFDSEALSERFPAYALPPGARALLDPAGGILSPEAAIRATVAAAQRHGAEVVCGAAVRSWEAPTAGGGGGGGGAVAVHTDAGTFRAGRLVLTAGAWMPSLVPELRGLIQVERQVVAWFRPRARPEHFTPERFPPFLLDGAGAGYCYGFSADDDGLVKVGKYGHLGQTGPAERVDYAVHGEDESALRRCVDPFFPALAGARVERAGVCMFTNTPDGHFLLAPHPAHPEVLLGSACSGHGFKFAPVVGEVLADLATAGTTQHDLSLHEIDPGRRGHPELLQRCGV